MPLRIFGEVCARLINLTQNFIGQFSIGDNRGRSNWILCTNSCISCRCFIRWYLQRERINNMYLNPGITANIIPLGPNGTNSTMFTECCECAICEDEPNCPGCGRKVVGHDTKSNHERRKIRWRNATSHWTRS